MLLYIRSLKQNNTIKITMYTLLSFYPFSWHNVYPCTAPQEANINGFCLMEAIQWVVIMPSSLTEL